MASCRKKLNILHNLCRYTSHKKVPDLWPPNNIDLTRGQQCSSYSSTLLIIMYTFTMHWFMGWHMIHLTDSLFLGENYAVGRPAYSSSVARDGISDPSLAVDNNTDPNRQGGKSCSATLRPELHPWWAVDLQRPRQVSSVETTNRRNHTKPLSHCHDHNFRPRWVTKSRKNPYNKWLPAWCDSGNASTHFEVNLESFKHFSKIYTSVFI